MLVLGALVGQACGDEGTEPVVYTDPADTVQVKVGESFWISLESNPTTGYKWQFGTPVDTTLLKLSEQKYVPDPNPEKLMGRGGRDHWLFEAIKPGSAGISLQYLRPWDSTSMERSVEFRVEINAE